MAACKLVVASLFDGEKQPWACMLPLAIEWSVDVSVKHRPNSLSDLGTPLERAGGWS